MWSKKLFAIGSILIVIGLLVVLGIGPPPVLANSDVDVISIAISMAPAPDIGVNTDTAALAPAAGLTHNADAVTAAPRSLEVTTIHKCPIPGTDHEQATSSLTASMDSSDISGVATNVVLRV